MEISKDIKIPDGSKKTAEDIMVFSGQQFRKIVKRSGFKATEVAKALGASDSTLWKYGHDMIMPRPQRIKDMANILSVEVSDFNFKENTDEDLQGNNFTSPFTEQEQKFINFFLTCPRVRQEKLLGLFEGILIGESFRTGRLGSDLSESLSALSKDVAKEQSL